VHLSPTCPRAVGLGALRVAAPLANLQRITSGPDSAAAIHKLLLAAAPATDDPLFLELQLCDVPPRVRQMLAAMLHPNPKQRVTPAALYAAVAHVLTTPDEGPLYARLMLFKTIPSPPLEDLVSLAKRAPGAQLAGA
jgi:hypothetical protein